MYEKEMGSMYEIPKISEDQAVIILKCIASSESVKRFISRLGKGEFACVEEKDIRDFIIAFLTKQFEIVEDEIDVGDWIAYEGAVLLNGSLKKTESYGEVKDIFFEDINRTQRAYRLKDGIDIDKARLIRRLSDKEKEGVIEEEIYRKIHDLDINDKYSILEKIRGIREKL